MLQKARLSKASEGTLGGPSSRAGNGVYNCLLHVKIFSTLLFGEGTLAVWGHAPANKREGIRFLSYD